MKGRDRRPRFRSAVYEPREKMTNGCRVLLLRLADSMNANGVVSQSRSQLADELGVAPARITENITLAKKLGFLGTVRRGRPGVTAVYQGQIPASDMVRKPGGVLVREGVPPEDATWYATAGSQVGNANCPPTRYVVGDVPDERRIYGNPGEAPPNVRAEVNDLENERRSNEENSA